LRQFGLIGYPLSHSFSQGFFSEKFLRENIKDANYANFPIASISELNALWQQHPALEGLNITIPYKKEVIPFIQYPSSVVQKINACNCIRKFNKELYGYNTDVIGFEKSLLPLLKPHHNQALILGTGGAAAAVEYVMQKLGVTYQLVSRSNHKGASIFDAPVISYDALNADVVSAHTLLINTSPIGMYPNTTEAPAIPYEGIGANHYLYDLVYNPAATLFLSKGKEKGAAIKNGLDMLHIQAEESWAIWNASTPIQQS
jgi:shikimate dehydrogenase